MSEDKKRPLFSDLHLSGLSVLTLPPDAVFNIWFLLEVVFSYLTSRQDRNAASLVCKSWYLIEAKSRSELFIGNCYAVSPSRVIERFPKVNSVAIKGKPRMADFGILPPDWGGQFSPWVISMTKEYRDLEKVYLKRMSLTNDDLALLANSLPNIRELVLVCCDKFGTTGLSNVASKCSRIRVLDLIESKVLDDENDWMSCFPQNGTPLQSLSFACVECPVNFEALEQLVVRSPSLKKLQLNRFISIVQLYGLMVRAPQLTHLGTGAFSVSNPPVQEPDYLSGFASCQSLVSLSGFREIFPDYLLTILPVCANLNSLDLRHASTVTPDLLKPVFSRCYKLQTLWVCNSSVCDEGLQVVATTCKDLRELCVFAAREDVECPVTEVGLLAISGCKKLQYLLYFCRQMTNAALIAMSKNCPDVVVFRLCIMGRYGRDHTTGEPMDEGFGAVVMNCKKLTRLAVSGFLTHRGFSYIGEYAQMVSNLSVAFDGDGDLGLKYVLQGCPRLKKLEIRDSIFGHSVLSEGLKDHRYMRSLSMSNCRVSRVGWERITRSFPYTIMEIINRDQKETADFVGTFYIYWSLEDPRKDSPRSVDIPGKMEAGKLWD